MRDKLGRFMKGYHPSPKTEFKKGQHHSPRTEFKKGNNGNKSPAWKGGKYKKPEGYILVYKPEHPFCDKDKYVREHRLIVEQYIGRYLTKKEIVHHINEIRDDNRIENLMLFKNGAYHCWFHRKGYCNPNGIIFDGRNIHF